MFSEHLLFVDCLMYISTANTRGSIIIVLVRKVVLISPALCCSNLNTETFFWSVVQTQNQGEPSNTDKFFFSSPAP